MIGIDRGINHRSGRELETGIARRDSDLLANYHLLDFGDGRRLESISGYVIDRPCPAAESIRRSDAAAWRDVDAVFKGHRWQFRTRWPEAMYLEAEGFRLAVAPKPYGHLGFFPEQSPHWQWLQSMARQYAQSASPAALNMFAYTGGSTLALASAGCAVAHVDAARPSVSQAGDNARASQLGDATIRYLVDDARQFVAREIRRQRQYSIITLDPPTYGHGVRRGNDWQIDRDLWPLLDGCLELLARPGALLITGHSDTLGPTDVATWLRSQASAGLQIDTGRSTILDRQGRSLDAGFYIRATR